MEAGCHAAIFQAEKEEMDDSSVDFPLKTLCKEPIRRFCKNDLNQALDCLKASLLLLLSNDLLLLVLSKLIRLNIVQRRIFF